MPNSTTQIKQSPEIASGVSELDIYKCYKNSKYLSIKYSSYFQTYQELLEKYRGKPIVFVEVGVLNGGSLFMWRSFFGQEARIIGIDLNPIAKKWEKDGFEIYIGNQADPKFWEGFFTTAGDVDIVLDDGGHTNEQQIITTHNCIPHINDGGMLIVEDTHTSYFKEFGNPSKYSFINYAKLLIDSVNSRFPTVDASRNVSKNAVCSLAFYESIVCFNIDRKKCFENSSTSNDGISSNAEDFRHRGSSLNSLSSFKKLLSERFGFLKKSGVVQTLSKKIFSAALFVSTRLNSHKLRKYFH